MSHTTQIRSVVIKSVTALEAAVRELKNAGLDVELVANQTPRAYYKDQISVCEFVVKLGNSRYDVGLKLNAEGIYEPMFDSWQGDIKKVLGCDCPATTADEKAAADIGKLIQTYLKHVGIEHALGLGLQYEVTTMDDGRQVVEMYAA